MALREIPTLDMHLVRGDTFEQRVGVGGFYDLADNPDDYETTLVIRRDHNDALPILLSIAGVREDPPEGVCEESVDWIYRFTATPTETSALPPYDLVYHVELRGVSGDPVRTLFRGTLEVTD